MKLTPHSKNRLMTSFHSWGVPIEYSDVIYGYLVHGHSPGSFFTAVLKNDFAEAIMSSHPSNTVPALKSLVAWLNHYLPKEMAWGSPAAVSEWLLLLDSDLRRARLENLKLIYTEKEELLLILKN